MTYGESLRKAIAERRESARRGVRHGRGGIRRSTGEIGRASGGYTRRTKEEQPGRQRRSGGPIGEESASIGNGGPGVDGGSSKHGGRGGSGGGNDSAKIVECGGLDGADGSRPFGGDGGPGGDDGSRGRGGLARSGRRSRASRDQKSHVLSLLFWHIPVDVRLGEGGCREDFRPGAETRATRTEEQCATLHT